MKGMGGCLVTLHIHFTAWCLSAMYAQRCGIIPLLPCPCAIPCPVYRASCSCRLLRVYVCVRARVWVKDAEQQCNYPFKQVNHASGTSFHLI